jgi:hypothetical protein
MCGTIQLVRCSLHETGPSVRSARLVVTLERVLAGSDRHNPKARIPLGR